MSKNDGFLKRYKNSNGGRNYEAFLTNKGYTKDSFGSKEVTEQLVELKEYFSANKLMLDRSKKSDTIAATVPSGLTIDKVIKWANDSHLSDAELGKKIRGYSQKIKELAQLDNEIAKEEKRSNEKLSALEKQKEEILKDI
jgi:hypothetical protein